MKLYLKIRELRQKKGFTQKELADLLEVSEVTISNFENNKKTPSMKRALQIATILECSLDDLIYTDKYVDNWLKELDDLNKEDIERISKENE